jgi:hypothetical protein
MQNNLSYEYTKTSKGLEDARYFALKTYEGAVIRRAC